MVTVSRNRYDYCSLLPQILTVRFDKGIQMDLTGWFSVTPEVIAIHVAKR